MDKELSKEIDELELHFEEVAGKLMSEDLAPEFVGEMLGKFVVNKALIYSAGDSGRDSKFLREVGKEVKTWIMG